jgi:hypothetical protein
LVIRAYPECFATTPELAGCSEGVVVESVNDMAADQLEFVTEPDPVLRTRACGDHAAHPVAVQSRPYDTPLRSHGAAGIGAGTESRVAGTLCELRHDGPWPIAAQR